MRTDEYGCEIVERRRRRGKGLRPFFFGTAVGIGLLAGVGVSEVLFPPAAHGQWSSVASSTESAWRMPEILRSNLTRTGGRVPNLISAELEIWHRVNASLAAVLPE